MSIAPGTARTAAGVIAFVAWLGLAVQFGAILGQGLSPPESLWVMLRYFTILTNLLVAVVFTGIALGKSAFTSQVLLGWVTIAILFVGVGYVTLLRGLLELSGGARLADTILHYVTPVAVLVYWLAFAPKGALSGRDALRWSIYPLAYGAYALTRGAFDNKYPYPFIDVGKLGWPQTALNLTMLIIGFVVASYVLVRVDGLMSRRAKDGA